MDIENDNSDVLSTDSSGADWICLYCGVNNTGFLTNCSNCDHVYKARPGTLYLTRVGNTHIRALGSKSRFRQAGSSNYLRIAQVKESADDGSEAPVDYINIGNKRIWYQLVQAVEESVFPEIGWVSQNRAYSQAASMVSKFGKGQSPNVLPEHIQPLLDLITNSLTNFETEDTKEFIAGFSNLAKGISNSNIGVLTRLLGQATDLKESELIDWQKQFDIWFSERNVTVVNEAHRRLAVVKVFESLVKLRETKEIELHKMIELEPWLINDSFTLSFSNRTFQSILEKKLKPADYEEYGKMRPDLAGIEGEDTFSLIELKRPKLKVSEDELNQLEKYLVVLRKHLTQYDQIVGYLIGDETSENFTRHLNHRKNIHFISYWDLIASVKKRCKAFLESN